MELPDGDARVPIQRYHDSGRIEMALVIWLDRLGRAVHDQCGGLIRTDEYCERCGEKYVK